MRTADAAALQTKMEHEVALGRCVLLYMYASGAGWCATGAGASACMASCRVTR
jgi:hypothetical protein